MARVKILMVAGQDCLRHMASLSRSKLLRQLLMTAPATTAGFAVKSQNRACSMTKIKTPPLVTFLFWLRGQDSNLRPRGYEPRELPLLHPASSGTIL